MPLGIPEATQALKEAQAYLDSLNEEHDEQRAEHLRAVFAEQADLKETATAEIKKRHAIEVYELKVKHKLEIKAATGNLEPKRYEAQRALAAKQRTEKQNAADTVRHAKAALQKAREEKLKEVTGH